MTHLLQEYGLVLVFVLVAIESAGIPIPGETVLILAAAAAAPPHHTYSIGWVIVVGALAAIIGDNVGYWIGRTGGRRLLERWDFVARYWHRVMPPAERFVEKHGPKAVFFGRFIAVLRVTVAWLSGITRMEWGKFFFWNATGSIVWASLVCALAYWFGQAAADAIERYGFYAVIVLAVAAVVGYFGVRWFRKRVEQTL